MLKKRVITALVLISVFGSVLFLSSPRVFNVFLALVLLASSWEWANLCGIRSPLKRILYALLMLIAGVLLHWLNAIQRAELFDVESVLLIACVWWAVALLWIQGYPSSVVLWKASWMRMLMGMLVLLPTWVALSCLRGMPGGEYLVLSVVLIVAATDIGAYFSGKKFGRRKLAPLVSPGKSWEGVVGGVLSAALLCAVFVVITQREDFYILLVVVLPAAMVSVLGDLLESMLKRHRGIKDSSRLLPGHGGVLDRIDGLVAAVPVFTLTLLLSETRW